jgi:hypothetical protein
MKTVIILVCLMLSQLALADIDEATMKSTEPKAGEVKSARSCFQELETFGCRHPREDIDQFKTCMENVHSSLSDHCQLMMNGLYRKKK